MPTLAGAVMCRTHGIPAEAGAESGVVGQLRSNNDRGRYVQDVIVTMAGIHAVAGSQRAGYGISTLGGPIVVEHTISM